MKGKSRRKRRRKKSKVVFLSLIVSVAVLGTIAIGITLYGIGLGSNEDVTKSPEKFLVEYMDHIPKQEYEEMYVMIDIEASNNISQEDFKKRNSAIYGGRCERNRRKRICC